MGYHASKWARETRGLSRPDKYVLLVLASWADDKDFRAWPTRDQLLADCEMPPRTLARALGFLQKQGYLTPMKHGNQHQTTIYQLNLDMPPVALAQSGTSSEEVPVLTEEVPKAALGSATSGRAIGKVSSQSSLISSQYLAAFQTLGEIPGFSINGRTDLMTAPLTAWLDKNHITPQHAEDTALSMLSSLSHEKGVWVYRGINGKRSYTDLVAVFRKWAKRPALPSRGPPGQRPQEAVDPRQKYIEEAQRLEARR